MRRWLLTIGFVVAVVGVVLAQDSGATLPAHCLIGDLFQKTGTSAGLYQCVAIDTWSRVPKAPEKPAIVLYGSTCPPVDAPSGGAGSIYTCTTDGSLYAWSGTGWALAGAAAQVFPVHFNLELGQIATSASNAGSAPLAKASQNWNHSAFNTCFTTGLTTSNQTGSQAIGDYVSVDQLMAAGTWSFVLWAEQNTNAGQISLDLDGVSVGTIDTYGSFNCAIAFTVTGVTVTTGGLHELKLRVTGKNSSSTDYFVVPSALVGQRTGA